MAGNLAFARTTGLIGGAILLISYLIYFPGYLYLVSTALWFISIVFLLSSLRQVSNYTGDKSIFNNYAIAIGLGIVYFAAVLSPSLVPTSPISLIYYSSPYLYIGILFILLIAGAGFIYMSFTAISSKLKISTFKTSSEILIVYAVISVGGIFYSAIFYLAKILVIVFSIVLLLAFSNLPGGLKDQGRAASSLNSTNAIPSSKDEMLHRTDRRGNQGNTPSAMVSNPNRTPHKFCIKCGVSIPASASFCPSCGSKQ